MEKYGNRLAREVSQRIAPPIADLAALTALPVDQRADGRLVVKVDDDTLWVFDESSAAPVAGNVAVPDTGTGRWLKITGQGGSGNVRGVITANVANLAAFTVAGNDGLTYAESQRVLLAGQTTPAECGVYVVGAVSGGTAPLTRATDHAAGQAVLNGEVIEVSEGTLWQGSSWKALCTGAKVIGTDDPLYYPRVIHRTVLLSAGAYTFGIADALFLFSTSKSQVAISRNTAGTSTATTGGYAAPAASRTAGKSGTASLLVRAEVAAGTLNNADVSTLDVTIHNW